MDKFMKIYKKLFKNNNNDNLVSIIEKIITDLESHKNDKYRHNVKYSTKEYICGIIEVLSNNVSWRKYNGLIDGRVLNNKHNYYQKIGVYEELYKINLDKYLEKYDSCGKYLSIDSTFIPNKYGVEKIGRNKFYKNKQGRKVTAIVDKKGTPIKVHINKGNRHDARIAPKIINKLPINTNEQSKYILADKGYDSKKIRKIIRNKCYRPIISRRKCKNNVKRLKASQKRKYKKRIIVENYFAWLKAFPKIDKIYEKKVCSYEGLLYLAMSIIIFKRC